MLAQIHRVAAYLLVLQGAAYVIAAVIVFDGRLSLDALRFAGTGLGWIYLALLNLGAVGGRERRAVTLALCANGLGLAYFALLAVAAPSWRTVVALVLVLACLAGSVTALRQLRARHGGPGTDVGNAS
jgi:hypothetical protein